MTLYEKSLLTLELNKVLTMLAAQAQTEKGKQSCLALRPQTSLYECEKLQQQCADAVHLMGMLGSPYLGGIKNPEDGAKRAQIGGSLNLSELLSIAQLLKTSRLTRNYVSERRNEKTSIDEYFYRLTGNKYLEEKILAAIISEEEVADNASSELYDIRRQIRNSASKIRDVLAKITSSQSNSKMLQDNIVTMRGGRYVVPVKSEYRGAFGGLVHDVSSSGATIFMEPAAVVELNNTIRVLSGREQNEIERILAEFSAEIGQFADSIIADYEVLCELDFIFARGKLAYDLKCLRPKLTTSGKTNLKRARHPLLDREKAVPIDFKMGGGCDTVIITGPNTGGKTVSIKTLGLLILMAQCGLQIPAADGSEVSIYGAVLADIGDEQSIEQSLSTFSSHMTNIVDILAHADNHTLVLLDELGAGTDPVEGAAIAVAIIQNLRGRGCHVAATTHYAELKVFALETEGVENASCEFDVQTLRPTYKLIFGVPGKSNAFAISERLGLSHDIIVSASENIDTQNKQFENVIGKLEEKRQALEGRLERAEKDMRSAEESSARARERLETVEAEREKLVLEAKAKAKEILDNARATSDYVLNEAKRLRQEIQEGDDPNLQAAKAAFRGQLTEAETKIQLQRNVRKAKPLPRALRPGDNVEIVSSGIKGTVVELNGDSAKVQAGVMKFSVSKTDLQLLESEKPKAQVLKAQNYISKPEARGMELDLRGQSADEGIMEVDRFIDNAIRLRLPSIVIIHGKGTGVLRSAVHSYLKSNKQVQGYRLGTFGEGESGVTIVTLK